MVSVIRRNMLSLLFVAAVLAGAGRLAVHALREPMGGAPETVLPVETGAMDPAEMLGDFAADLARLTERDHRRAGSLWGEEAARYVLGRLEEAGIEAYLQRFPVVTPEYSDVTISVDGGEDLQMWALRPNLLVGSVTPEEGISGRTVYARSGSLSHYGSADPAGKIVVLDFAEGALNWQTAFSLGAKAVLFVGGEEPAAAAWHHVNIPALLPRFYVPAEQADALGLRQSGKFVTLRSRMQWRRGLGYNVVGVIRGTSPVFMQKQSEAMVLAAPLDSFGEVPDLSPGARGGGNAAALLGIAEFLQENPTGRDVIVCFYDGQAQFHAGARAFYSSVLRRWRAKKYGEPVSKQAGMLEGERDYLLGVLEGLGREIGSLSGEFRRDVMLQLRNTARTLSNDHRLEVQRLRLRLAVLSEGEGEETGDVAELRAKLGEQEAMSQRWTALQREISMERFSEGTREDLRRVREECAGLLRERLEEIEQELACVGDALRLESALGDRFIVLHLSLDFGDRSGRWTFVQGDMSMPDHVTEDRPGVYQQDIFKTLLESRDLLERRRAGTLSGFDGRAIGGDLVDPGVFAPGPRADSGAVARLMGVWNVSAVTAFDRRERDGQPGDTVAAMEGGEEHIRSQGAELAVLAWALGYSDGLSLSRRVTAQATYVESAWSRLGISGATAMVLSPASAVADRPARGAVVAVIPRGQARNWSVAAVTDDVPGFEQNLLTHVDANGSIQFGPVSSAYFDVIATVCMLFDERGVPTHVSNAETVGSKLKEIGVKLFRATNFTAVGHGYDRRSVPTQVLRARSTAPFRNDYSLVAELGNVVSLFVPPDVEGVKLFNSQGLSVLNNTAQQEAGVGVALGSPFETLATGGISSRDLWTLNESRLQMLRRNHIMEQSLQRMHHRAEELLQQAEGGDEGEGQTFSAAWSRRTAANAVSRRVYQPLLGVLNDLVTAVVFLLLLAMPFAYALERLLIGTPHIYRQIVYVSGLFLLTFGVLYCVNPAFRIAATPVVIFLAFAIIVLSSLVIFIVMRKLQEEVRRMQGLGATVHSADVSRLSTTMAAVNMGISTMRRRPLRTLLTAVTVVLLTFTILSFASFSSTWGIRRSYVGSGDGLHRLLVRQALWGVMDEGVVEMLRGHVEDRATLAARWWVAPTAWEADQIVLGRRPPADIAVSTDGGGLAVLSAVVGIEAEELEREARGQRARLSSLLPDGGEGLRRDGVYLSESVAKQIGAEVGDEVWLGGVKLKLAGVLPAERMAAYVELDGSSILPVDYQSSQGGVVGTFSAAENTAGTSEDADMESAQFVNYPPDRVALACSWAVRRLGGRIRAVQVYPDRALDLSKLGEEIATLAPMPVYVGGSDGVQRMIFTTLTAASGFDDLVIPVVLGGLIVFATLLGSVSDREREIYTFSALGLAPAHVASLFLAEACVYAVVGGMGGYLLGQSAGWAMGMMSRVGWVTAPPMNYSSTNAIVTLLLVMATVLVSTIYPAIKASRSANPGVQRNWKMPAARGDVHDILFPFTVSSYDITGVVSFLKEHFDNYRDTTLGSFATQRSEVFRQGGVGMLGFRAEVALAPFDLGVTQEFTLLAQPSEIEGIDEVRIVLKRQSGAPGDWRRANKVFVAELRKQLLIWRALPTEVTERYRGRTLEQWEGLPVAATMRIEKAAGTGAAEEAVS